MSRTGINLIFTGNWLKALHADFFKEFGLTHQQHNILRILRGQRMKPVNVEMLKARMMDRMSNVSRILERLKRKELIQCTPSDADKRTLDIVITEQGLDLLHVIDEEVHKINDLLGHMNQKELEQLNELLDKVRNRW